MNRIKRTLTYAMMALALACFTPALVPSQQTVVEAASVKIKRHFNQGKDLAVEGHRH